LQYLNTAGMSN